MNYTLKVLFVDESRLSVETTVAELKRQGFEIGYDQVSTCCDLLDRLRGKKYDLIVSVYDLSTTSVLEVVRLLSENSIQIPIIVIAEEKNEDQLINALQAGCRDYLVRSNLERLKAIILRIIFETEKCLKRDKVEEQLTQDTENTNMNNIVISDFSRVRSIEQQLREEQKKLSAIFNAAPVGIIILDRDLVVRRVNIALANYIGKRAGSMLNKRIGMSFSCINSTQSSNGCGYGSACQYCSLRRIILSVNRSGLAVYGKEIQHGILVKRNLKNLWLRVNAVPITISGIKHVILVADDITQSKKTEEALERSRDFYLKLFESFPALIWRSGRDAKCDYFNNSWLKFTGRSLQDELGDGWVSGVHPDDCEKCINTYREAFKKRQSFEIEYRLRRNDGVYRWIFDAGRPLYDEKQGFLGYIGSCYDVTANKNQLELLSKYQLLSEKANDIIYFIDSLGNIVEVNNATLAAYGYTREEFQTLSIFDLRKTEETSIINEQLNTVWDHSIVFNSQHFRKDGSSFPVEVSWSGAKIGNKRMILCVVRDITEHKKLLDNLGNNNQELQAALNELNLAQVQLVQQEKLAAIGHLAAGVAHEINNPLGFIMSNLETLETYSKRLKEVIEKYGELREVIAQDNITASKRLVLEISDLEKRFHVNLITADLKALLEDTNEGLNRIKKIVTGLRIFSRVDDQDVFANYDLNEGIENTIMVANNEIKYYADVEKNFAEIPLIPISGNLINQVLLNIIINAVQSIKARQDTTKGLIRISTYKEKGYICCEIEDSGIGIEKENLSKIFNPFFTTKPVGSGTGLGLSISYDIIVNKYGGEMIVDSIPGQGTVFIVKIPCLEI